jgi:hypothetical protein
MKRPGERRHADGTRRAGNDGDANTAKDACNLMIGNGLRPWVLLPPPPGIADAVVPGRLLLLGFQSGLRGKVKDEVNADAR